MKQNFLNLFVFKFDLPKIHVQLNLRPFGQHLFHINFTVFVANSDAHFKFRTQCFSEQFCKKNVFDILIFFEKIFPGNI